MSGERTSNEAFRTLQDELSALQTDEAATSLPALQTDLSKARERVAAAVQLLSEAEQSLLSMQTRLEMSTSRKAQITQQLKALRPRLCWSSLLPREVRLAIMGQLRMAEYSRAALVCKGFHSACTVAFLAA